MTSWATAGTAVVLLGIVLASPPVVFIGAAMLIIRVLAEVWPRRVLNGLQLERHVWPPHAVAGEEVELSLSLWNGTRLPAAWATVSDAMGVGLVAATASGERRIGGIDLLTVASALRPYERVTRRFRVTPIRRGIHEIGPAQFRVAELFGAHTPIRDADVEPLRILARPRAVPVSGGVPARAPLAHSRARRSLFSDPSLFAGVRPFQSGDPLKSIHWRATARRAELQTKRFEPSLASQAVLVFDVQTVEGEYWMLVYDEQHFEDLAVAAASVAREMVSHSTACGFAAANFSGSTQRYVYLPPRTDRLQLGRIGDALARLTPESSAPLTRLLAWLPRRVAAGTMIVIFSSRSAVTSASVVRRLRDSGYPVHFVLAGQENLARQARQAGLAASSVRVEAEAGVPRAVAVHG
jgi:uncharacterized protein (DUF58 family)